MADFETTDKYTSYFLNYNFFQMCLQIHIYCKISHSSLMFLIIVVGPAIAWVPIMCQEPYLVLFTVNKPHHWQQLAQF